MPACLICLPSFPMSLSLPLMEEDRRFEMGDREEEEDMAGAGGTTCLPAYMHASSALPAQPPPLPSLPPPCCPSPFPLPHHTFLLPVPALLATLPACLRLPCYSNPCQPFPISNLPVTALLMPLLPTSFIVRHPIHLLDIFHGMVFAFYKMWLALCETLGNCIWWLVCGVEW